MISVKVERGKDKPLEDEECGGILQAIGLSNISTFHN